MGEGRWTNSSYDDSKYYNTEILRTGMLKTYTSRNRKALLILEIYTTGKNIAKTIFCN